VQVLLDDGRGLLAQLLLAQGGLGGGRGRRRGRGRLPLHCSRAKQKHEIRNDILEIREREGNRIPPVELVKHGRRRPPFSLLLARSRLPRSSVMLATRRTGSAEPRCSRSSVSRLKLRLVIGRRFRSRSKRSAPPRSRLELFLQGGRGREGEGGRGRAVREDSLRDRHLKTISYHLTVTYRYRYDVLFYILRDKKRTKTEKKEEVSL